MKLFQNILLIPILFLIPNQLSSQGALDGYMKGKGNLDVAPSISHINAQSLIGASQAKYNIPYSGQLISAFAAYGVNSKLDLVANLPYVISNEQKGLQDGGFYIKYRPLYLQHKNLGSLGIILGTGISIPLTNYQPTAAGAIGQRAILAPIRTIMQWDSPIGPFLNLTAGYNWRLDDYQKEDLLRIQQTRPEYMPEAPPNYTTLMLKLGLPAAHYYLDGWIEWQLTPVNLGANFVPGTADLPQAYGISYTQVGGTLYYSEKGHNGVFFSAGKILNGRNTSQTLRLTGGMVFKINHKASKKS